MLLSHIGHLASDCEDISLKDSASLLVAKEGAASTVHLLERFLQGNRICKQKE